MFRVLVTGSRHLRDLDFVAGKLDALLVRRRPWVAVVHGAGTGADELAGRYAAARGFGIEPFPADWHAHGRAAGPLRNAAMVATRPDAVVAFPAGESRGTRDCMFRATLAGVPMQVYELDLDDAGFVTACRPWADHRPGVGCHLVATAVRSDRTREGDHDGG